MPPEPPAGRRGAWLRLALRLVLALALIPEGLALVIPVAAPPPLPSTLLLRLGELPPYRLLETFLGYSPGYQAFTGVAALLGGLLLLSARTSLLGALLAVAALGMAALQRLLYSGPGLAPASALLALALLLLAPDLRRLFDALVLGRTVEPAPEPSYFARPERDRAVRFAVAVLGLLLAAFCGARNALRLRDLHPPRPPLHGAWAVESLRLDGREVPPYAEPEAWGWLAFDRPGEVWVERRIGSRRRRALSVDEAAKTLRLEGVGGKGVETLAFSRPGPHRLVLDGRVEGRHLHAELRKMTLLSTPYHWPWGPEYEE